LKYYGHATPPYWKLIYEANKDVIGDNPAHVRRGMVVKIPVLPPDFKG
jgi:nucleoid-associated protein YgaU